MWVSELNKKQSNQLKYKKKTEKKLKIIQGKINHENEGPFVNKRK